MERRVLTSYGEINYELTKKKIKKMYLRVKPEGRVVVSVPTRVTLKEADLFVAKNGQFIQDALGRMETREAQRPSAPKFTSGDVFYSLGEALTLRVEQGFPLSCEKIQGDLVIRVLDQEDKEQVREAVKTFYTNEMRETFVTLMERYQRLLSPLGIPQAQLKIREMKSQWGSCNRRNNVITLNSRLIHLPVDCIEYVVLHEFCHFVHGNHSKDFYDLVSVYMADWKPRRQAMKKWAELF